MDVNFWKISHKEFPRVKTTLKVLNIVDAASGMHIVIQIADQTAEDHLEGVCDRMVEMGWKPEMSSG